MDMKRVLLSVLFAFIVSGCAQFDYKPFSTGLLTYESLKAIENSVDPTQDVGPWYKMSRSQLIQVLGEPHAIKRSEVVPRIEQLTYCTNNVSISFYCKGAEITAMEYGELSKFSKPEYSDQAYQVTNPFLDFSPSNVVCVVFIGTGPAARGPLFLTRDPEEICELYTMASVLTNKSMIGFGCVGLVTAEFMDSQNDILGRIMIEADGKTVGLNDSNGYLDKNVSSLSRPLALKCFELMLKHCPEDLKKIKANNDKCTKDHLVPSFPFDKVN
jgi:hypothetical protein